MITASPLSVNPRVGLQPGGTIAGRSRREEALKWPSFSDELQPPRRRGAQIAGLPRKLSGQQREKARLFRNSRVTCAQPLPFPSCFVLFASATFLATCLTSAGPPFVTDDPEPVDYQHWEVYIASILGHSNNVWSGTSPHVEVNYGAITNLQLHIIAPISFVAPAQGPTRFGYGDTELGAKYRFIDETTNSPQIGVFPLLEVPTGDTQRGLGGGHLQAFLPLWLQKSFGPWTTHGGGGYWINPGAGNENWWYEGWLLQRQMTKNLTVGAEIYHDGIQGVGIGADTRFNIGSIYDFTENHHLMFSAGHTIQGPIAFQAYIAFQFTFGPESKSDK